MKKTQDKKLRHLISAIIAVFLLLVMCFPLTALAAEPVPEDPFVNESGITDEVMEETSLTEETPEESQPPEESLPPEESQPPEENQSPEESPAPEQSAVDEPVGEMDSLTGNDNLEGVSLTLCGVITGIAWMDINENGIQDDGPHCLHPGVPVQLLFNGAPIAETSTNSLGLYTFMVPLGTYAVRFADISNKEFTSCDAGGSDQLDSDAGSDGITAAVTLGFRSLLIKLDCGYLDRTPASIGGTVWEDANFDGIQDAGETGLPGVTVELLQGDAVLSATATDVSGNYSFTNLAPGTYSVRFYTLQNMAFSPTDAGDDTLDSDADSGGITSDIALGRGDNITCVDCGMAAIADCTIGGYAWIDADQDGIQDESETSLEGVTVVLFAIIENSPQPAGNTTTDASGRYSFAELPIGSYQLQFVFASAYLPTLKDAGDDAADSDIDAQGYSSVLALVGEAGGSAAVDAGFVPQYCSIGDRVWLDTDEDGVQDLGENGINGITVELYIWGTQFQLVGSTVTANHNGEPGWYSFSNLPDGLYRIRFVLGDSGYSFSPSKAGSDASLDSDADSSGNTAWVLHATYSLKDDTSIDAGLIEDEEEEENPRTGDVSSFPDDHAWGGIITCGSTALLLPLLVLRRKKIGALLHHLEKAKCRTAVQ